MSGAVGFLVGGYRGLSLWDLSRSLGPGLLEGGHLFAEGLDLLRQLGLGVASLVEVDQLEGAALDLGESLLEQGLVHRGGDGGIAGALNHVADIAGLELVEGPAQGLAGGGDVPVNKESRVTRSLKREVISRGYNLMVRSMFFAGFPDAQCGFKALTRQAAQAIVPHVKNNNWFFDTELLVIAAKRGYRIRSVPVKWDDDPNSTVDITSTAAEDIRGLLRLRFGGIPPADPRELDR